MEGGVVALGDFPAEGQAGQAFRPFEDLTRREEVGLDLRGEASALQFDIGPDARFRHAGEPDGIAVLCTERPEFAAAAGGEVRAVGQAVARPAVGVADVVAARRGEIGGDAFVVLGPFRPVAPVQPRPGFRDELVAHHAVVQNRAVAEENFRPVVGRDGDVRPPVTRNGLFAVVFQADAQSHLVGEERDDNRP